MHESTRQVLSKTEVRLDEPGPHVDVAGGGVHHKVFFHLLPALAILHQLSALTLCFLNQALSPPSTLFATVFVHERVEYPL